MSNAVKSQLEVKAKCEQQLQSLKDLSDWVQEMNQTETRYKQQKDQSRVNPPIRSHVDEIDKFAEDQKVTEKDYSCVDRLIASEHLKDAEIFNQKGIEFCKRTKEGEDYNMYKEKYGQTAIEMFTKAIEINDRNPAYYVNRAQCYFNLERYEETITDCDIAISIENKHVTAHYRRMKAFEHLGKNKLAYINCQQLLKLTNNANELVKIKQDMERIETRLRQEADKLKLQGNTQLGNKNYVKACEYFSKAIDVFENDSIYYHNRSLCYFHMKNYENCLEDCNKAIELDRGYFRPYYQRMRVREQKGEYYEAIIDCKKFLDLVRDEKQRLTAKKDLERLQRALELKQEPKSFQWNELSKNASLINFIQKPPHLRSKVPLRRIQISEDISSGDNQTVPTNYVVASDYETIPDDVIDKMFNNNTGERVDHTKHDTGSDNQSFIKAMPNLKNYFSPPVTPSSPPKDTLYSQHSPLGACNNSSAGKDEVKTSKYVSESEPTLTVAAEPKIEAGLSQSKLEKEMINQGNYQPETTDKKEGNQNFEKTFKYYAIPSTTVEFNQTWINLQNPIDRFELLKLVESGPLDKLLGVNLSSSMLSDILLLLDQYCTKQNYCPLQILTKIAENSEIAILALLLSDKDKKCLSNLLKLMKSMEVIDEALEKIRNCFNIDSCTDGH
ncbi:RNA polymerase II-associated protein 3 isoform X2 [Sabethes cyaneus]|uniref:RNA polymerase II-associated protein 3 isoform X2 n=1 Tax=Sabethes cyaneus TaxID=53552 RepID=UPI00237DC1A7|nr:RNA polymerase II-associated protein 3 isoform X2 [Sabethes cyaneus]